MCSRWATPPRTSQVWGEMVSGSFFDMLGVQPEAGRFFSGAERDDAQNAHAVVVISHSYWKIHYHSDRSAIGASLRINRTLFTIIGVAPEGFHGTRSGLDYEMWMPLTMYGQLTHTGTWMLRDRNTRPFMMYGAACARSYASSRRVAKCKRLPIAWQWPTRTRIEESALRCFPCGSRTSARRRCC